MIVEGMRLPSIALAATNGETVDLSAVAGIVVVYVYPRTSPADGGAIPGWDAIPGARGCTAQSCAFRDHHAALSDAGAQRVFGLSVQSTDYQREAAERLHLPFPLLSDEDRSLAVALGLPVFEAGGMTLLQRLTFVAQAGRVVRVLYPIERPADNAQDVLAWLSQHRGLQRR